MKYFVSVEEMESLVNIIGVVAGNPDDVLELSIGVKKVDNSLLNTANVTSGTEQVSTSFICGSPTGDENVTYPLNIAVKAKEFLTIAGSVLTLKEQVYLDISSTSVSVGVNNSVRLVMSVVANDKVPPHIPMNKNDLIMQMKCDTASFKDALNGGASFISTDSDDTRGIGNAVISVSYSVTEGNASPGSVRIYSSNGIVISKACAAVAVINNQDILDRCEAYKTTYKLNDFTIAVPKKPLNDLQKLVGSTQDFIIAFCEKHGYVAIGKRTMFTFTQGSKICSVVYKADEWHQALLKSSLAVTVVDADVLKTKIDMLNKVTDTGKAPVKITITENKDMEIKAFGEVGEVFIKPVDQSVKTPVVIYLNSKRISEILSTLKKGNVRISFMDIPGKPIGSLPVEIANGDMTKYADNTAVIFITPSKPLEQESSKKEEPVPKEATVKDTEEKAETSERENVSESSKQVEENIPPTETQDESVNDSSN